MAGAATPARPARCSTPRASCWPRPPTRRARAIPRLADLVRLMAAGGWPWGRAAAGRARDRTRSPPGAASRRSPCGAHLPGMVRGGARAPRRPRARHRRRGARPARGTGRTRRRGAARAGRLRHRADPCVHAARGAGHAADDPGRGRDRHRQDARLHRARQRVGGEEQGRGVDLDLHPQPAAPDRPGAVPPLSRPGAEGPQGGGAQGTRELPVPAEPGRRGHPRRARPERGRLARPDGALGRGDRATATWWAATSRPG